MGGATGGCRVIAQVLQGTDKDNSKRGPIKSCTRPLFISGSRGGYLASTHRSLVIPNHLEREVTCSCILRVRVYTVYLACVTAIAG